MHPDSWRSINMVLYRAGQHILKVAFSLRRFSLKPSAKKARKIDPQKRGFVLRRAANRENRPRKETSEKGPKYSDRNSKSSPFRNTFGDFSAEKAIPKASSFSDVHKLDVEALKVDISDTLGPRKPWFCIAQASKL